MSMPNGKTNGDAPRIGVYVCHCGINIAGKVNCSDVAKFAETLPNVVVSRDYKFMCRPRAGDHPGRHPGAGREPGGGGLVFAPDAREDVPEGVHGRGPQSYYFQMANIREHVSWVTKDKAEATEKSRRCCRGGAARRPAQPLETSSSTCTRTWWWWAGDRRHPRRPDAGQPGKHVYLIEREPTIGGHMASFDKTFPTPRLRGVYPDAQDVGREIPPQHHPVVVFGVVGWTASPGISRSR